MHPADPQVCTPRSGERGKQNLRSRWLGNETLAAISFQDTALSRPDFEVLSFPSRRLGLPTRRSGSVAI
jgi:hypothetical protein